MGDPHMGLGTAYSLGLSRRAQVAQRETRGPQPPRWPSGKVCEGCSGEQGGDCWESVTGGDPAKGQEGSREVRD